MRPPICELCRGEAKETVAFADYVPPDSSGPTGHPPGLGWFCGRHLPAARRLRGRSLGRALATLRVWRGALRLAALGLLAALAMALFCPRPGAAAEPTRDDHPAAGKIVEDVPTLDDPAQRYALYLPTGFGATDRTWPLLLVLDPRGRAVPGIRRFLPAAERHGWVVVSSYQSRSDTLAEVNVAVLNALLPEVQKRYRPDLERLYLAGMSGTAHAAWRFAQFLGDHVAGVIAAGGGVQTSSQGPPGEAGFAYYGIAGTADFNYQELMELERHLLERGIDHRIEIFEGRHGWPPHDFTNRAVDWMELQAVRRELRPADPALVDAALERARTAAAAAEDPLEELRRRRDVVRDFQDLRDVAAERAAVRRLEADPRVARRRVEEAKLAKAERTYLASRYRAWVPELRNPDRRPPTLNEALFALRVAKLRRRAESTDNPADAHSAQRLLDNLYVGFAFYLPREFERAGDLERLARSLEIAAEIYPSLPRLRWRLAETYVTAGRLDKALAALRRATSLGGVDLARLRTDPTWEPLRGRPAWRALIAGLTEDPPGPG